MDGVPSFGVFICLLGYVVNEQVGLVVVKASFTNGRPLHAVCRTRCAWQTKKTNHACYWLTLFSRYKGAFLRSDPIDTCAGLHRRDGAFQVCARLIRRHAGRGPNEPSGEHNNDHGRYYRESSSFQRPDFLHYAPHSPGPGVLELHLYCHKLDIF